MVGGRRGRVAAVVGGHDQQVVGAELGQHLPDTRVGLLQRLRVALDVVAVAVEHVEIHQVDEQQPRAVRLQRRQRLGDAVGVALGLDVVRHALPAVDVVNLPDAEGEHARLLQPRHQQRLGRIDGVVVAAHGAPEAAGLPLERPRNHPPHLMRRRQQVARGLAHAVELFHRNNLFVRGNLEDAVGGGVHNRRAGLHVLRAQLFDDLRPARRFVAQRLAAHRPLELFHHLGRKTVGIGRKGFLHVQARHLPVAGGGVFAGRGQRRLAVGGSRMLSRRQVLERFDVRQPQLDQVGQLQRPRSRHVPQRVAPGVAELRRVWHLADAHAVQHQQHHPLEPRIFTLLVFRHSAKCSTNYRSANGCMVMPMWKRLVLISASAGAGFALVLLLILGARSWYLSRPTPWNKGSIKTTFNYVETEGEHNQLIFHYTLENTTNFDYRIEDESNVVIMKKLEKQKSLSLDAGTLRGDFPVFVPARQRLQFAIHTQMHYTPNQVITVPLEELEETEILKGQAKQEAENRFRKKLAAFVMEEMTSLDGFVLFDKENHYRIDFPKGW